MKIVGWLADEDVLIISRNGDYTINSLSSNKGVRAATISNHWIEWREAINQDRDLPFTSHYYGSVVGGSPMIIGSLICRTVIQEGRTLLQQMIEPGKSATLRTPLGSILIEHFPTRGMFRVSGLPKVVGETVPSAIPTMPPTTTATTPVPQTYPPDIVLPPGRECRVSGAVGVCTSSSRCPAGASFKLTGCKTKGLGCCF